MSKKKTRKKVVKQPAVQSSVINDIVAILLTALALLSAISIFTPDSAGIFGKALFSFFTALFGKGAYFIPLLLLVTAYFYFSDTAEKMRSSMIGGAIVFCAALALYTTLVLDNGFFTLESFRSAGGFVGSVLGWPSRALFGSTGSIIFLSALILIGLVLSLNKPVKELFAALRVRVPPEKPVTQRSRKQARTVKIDRKEVTQPIEFAPPQDEPEPEPEPTGPVVTPAAEPSEYHLPPLELLEPSRGRYAKTDKELKKVIEQTLLDFDVAARVVDVQTGPTVTTFELQLEPGTSVKKLQSLQRDLEYALATPKVMIKTPIEGKSAIGIQVPNRYRELVTLRDLLEVEEIQKSPDPLLLPIGRTATGNPFFYSLRKMPHLLIAGTTGSGKSVCLNSIISTILFRAYPEQVKLILIDPKRVEFSLYRDIPHLMAPVITDPKQAASALSFVVAEMEKRFDLLSEMPARDIESYNKKAVEKGEDILPYVVVIIDELAELMLIAGKEVEEYIVRIAQMARAVGIHLVVATQRPQANIITGLIKSNITTRIAFAVGSNIDSRVILDTGGAEKLIGQGDMLFLTHTLQEPIRLQSPFISEEEVARVTDFVREQKKPEYVESVLTYREHKKQMEDEDDELIDEAIEAILTYDQASTSFLQRRLKIGYARAARIMDILETRGIVGPQQGAKPREILITREEWEAMKAGRHDDR